MNGKVRKLFNATTQIEGKLNRGQFSLYLLFSGHKTFRTSVSEMYLGRKIIAKSGKGLRPLKVSGDWSAGGGKQ
jgi:hypothetical protein